MYYTHTHTRTLTLTLPFPCLTHVKRHSLWNSWPQGSVFNLAIGENVSRQIGQTLSSSSSTSSVKRREVKHELIQPTEAKHKSISSYFPYHLVSHPLKGTKEETSKPDSPSFLLRPCNLIDSLLGLSPDYMNCRRGIRF